jgi:hypothetical protein
LPSLVRILFAPQPVSCKFKKEIPFSLALRPKQLREIQILHHTGHMAHYVAPQAIVKAVLDMERS